MLSVFVDVDSNKRRPTSRPVIGTEIQKDCNFEAHVYYFSYRLGCMSSRWYVLLSQLPYSHSVQLYKYILLPSCISRLVHKDFSRSQSSSGEPTKCTEHGTIQKGPTQCSVGALSFNCLLPYFTLIILCEVRCPNDIRIEGMAIVSVFFNLSLNPFLYCWKIIEVRQAVKQIIRRAISCAQVDLISRWLFLLKLIWKIIFVRREGKICHFMIKKEWLKFEELFLNSILYLNYLTNN